LSWVFSQPLGELGKCCAIGTTGAAGVSLEILGTSRLYSHRAPRDKWTEALPAAAVVAIADVKDFAPVLYMSTVRYSTRVPRLCLS